MVFTALIHVVEFRRIIKQHLLVDFEVVKCVQKMPYSHKCMQLPFNTVEFLQCSVQITARQQMTANKFNLVHSLFLPPPFSLKHTNT